MGSNHEYKMYYLEVEKAAVEMKDGKPVKDASGNYIKTRRWFPKHISEVTKGETTRCIHCGTDVVLHNDGKEIPHHVEHKSKQDAKSAQCHSIQNAFDEKASVERKYPGIVKKAA